MAKKKKQRKHTKENNQVVVRPEKKKWSKKRIILTAVISALLAAFVIGIVIGIIYIRSPYRPIKSSKEESRVVGYCGDYEVRYEELRYVTLLHRQSLDATLGKYETLDELGKDEYEKLLWTRVTEDLSNNYVILSLCDEYGIKTESHTVKKHVQDQIKQLIDGNFGGDRDTYKAWLGENNLTDSFLRLIYRVDYLETLLVDHFVANGIGIEYNGENRETFLNYVMQGEDWVRTIHAFYPKRSAYVDVSDSYERALATAEALASVSDDENRYSEMAKAIGNAPLDPDYSTSGYGVYFTYGAMTEDYEAAAFSLDIYGVSGVIEAEEGYYVIMRMPLEREHLTPSLIDNLLSQYQFAALKKQEDAERTKVTFRSEGALTVADLLEIQ